MSERPFIRPLEHRIELLPTQGEALRLGWAALYITLRFCEGRPILFLALGPQTPRFTPPGYDWRPLNMLVPRASVIPEGAQAPMPIGDQVDAQARQPRMFPADAVPPTTPDGKVKGFRRHE